MKMDNYEFYRLFDGQKGWIPECFMVLDTKEGVVYDWVIDEDSGKDDVIIKRMLNEFEFNSKSMLLKVSNVVFIKVVNHYCNAYRFYE